jgi:hypothetical protein
MVKKNNFSQVATFRLTVIVAGGSSIFSMASDEE